MEDKRKRFIGYFGQQRFSAKIPWKWDRQGQHMIVSFLVTIGAIGAALVLPPMLIGLIYLAITYVFVQYEVTETGDINDFAWPDLYGWALGVIPAVAIGVPVWYFFG